MFSQRAHVLFPPIDLRSTIFMYSGACKPKSLQSMRVSIIQTTWRERRWEQSCRARLALLSWKLRTFLLKMLLSHTENYKLELPLDCSTTQMEKNVRRMCGIEESSRRRGFAAFAIEAFYIVQE